MLRLTELRLSLDHPATALSDAICERLGIAPEDLVHYAIARRGNDARKKSAIKLVYAVDVIVKNEASVLARMADDVHVRPAPDTDYRFVTRAPACRRGPRPVVIGAGPCGMLAALGRIDIHRSQIMAAAR